MFCSFVFGDWGKACFAHFWQGAQSLAPATRSDMWTSKSGPNMWCFNISTWKCASRHNSVHFFNISISKSAPRMVCFVHCDLQMFFAPQRRALFHHLNFQKWSETVSILHFWLRNIFRATTACTFSFSSSQLPKVLRERCVLYVLTSKCASRHKGVQFFISHLARWLHTHRFSEPTMIRASGATNHWKNAVNRGFSTFLRTCIFFPLTLSLLWSSFFFLLSFFFSSLLFPSLLWPFQPLLFHLSILSEVWLRNFFRI